MTMKLLLALASVMGVSLAMRDQSVHITGKLMCGHKPAANVRVKLWEEDGGPDPDDLLDQGYTDGEGRFSLQGGTAELTPIDPIFKVYHDCDDGILPGSRKVKLGIPKSYITEGKVSKKTFELGTVNLETIFHKEEREMIVSRKRRTLRSRRSGANADYLDEMNSEKTEKENKVEDENEVTSDKKPKVHEKKEELTKKNKGKKDSSSSSESKESDNGEAFF